MSHHDPFESWKRYRAGEPLPEGFVDDVCEAVLLRENERARLRSRVVRVALGSLAAAVCLFRVLQVVILFVVERPTL
jgi:hypothetical protein